MIILGTGSPTTPQIAGFLKATPDVGVIENLLGDDPYQVSYFKQRGETSERIIAAASADLLGEIVSSPIFDVTGRSNLILEARGPHVDLSAYASPLSAARELGAEVVVLVYPPEARQIPSWGILR